MPTERLKAKWHEAKVAGAHRAPWEVRLLRVGIAVVLTYAAIATLDRLLNKAILEENKLEVGLLLGWLIAKSGTVIDWLFGGSESGTRRADIQAQQAERAPPPGTQSFTAPADAKIHATAEAPDDTDPKYAWEK